MERFAPLAGVLFLVLAVVAGALSGEGPDLDEAAAEHVEFWTEDEGMKFAASIVAAYAAIALVWFAASVREAIARVEPGPARLASISFAGAVLIAAGITVSSAIQVTLAETSDDLSPESVQTLSVLFFDFFFPMAAGVFLFLLPAGLAALRHGAFDRRLAWIAIVIGVLAVTPAGFFAFLATLVWCAVAGIVLYRKKDPVGSGAAPPPSSGPTIEVPPGAGPPPHVHTREHETFYVLEGEVEFR
ncbi:MAG: cupin domain-containing protein, partial [Actinomycetota bacterium]|nr:cupin domain-containing protein [Actinomycetota bacterium]